ncbi:MAG: hypothetical protein ABIL09_28860, partial [Gemmatimonadota bacterium]
MPRPQPAAPAPDAAPEELLALYDGAGRVVGTKARAAMHRDGDWHALAFAWVAWRGAGGDLRLLLQRRGRPRDP